MAVSNEKNPLNDVVSTIDPITWSETIDYDGGVATPTGQCPRAVLVDTEGLVEVEYHNDATDTIFLVAGVWHPMHIKSISESATTATGLHIGY
jgi:hypothetical protein